MRALRRPRRGRSKAARRGRCGGTCGGSRGDGGREGRLCSRPAPRRSRREFDRFTPVMSEFVAEATAKVREMEEGAAALDTVAAKVCTFLCEREEAS